MAYAAAFFSRHANDSTLGVFVLCGASVDGVFAALGDGPAAGRMDLLTVLLHELGHIAGLDDLDAASIPDGLMTELLSAGVRRLPR